MHKYIILSASLYLKSGDPIQIRESILEANPNYVTSACGFVILQSQSRKCKMINNKATILINTHICDVSKIFLESVILLIV